MTMIKSAVYLCLVIALISFNLNAEEMSAEAAAKELANPNTALASLNFKLQFRGFTGDVPGADDQSGSLLLFQPSMPFPVENGTVLFRPAIPLISAQPSANGLGGFEDVSGMGDIVFDLAYAPKRDDGLLIAYGFVSSLPVATKDELSTDRFTLGPELLIGKITQEYVLGAFPNHQWDVGGSGDKTINLTSVQFFASILPGGGWNYGSNPIISYDWETDELTFPLNINFGKTVLLGGRPWKLSTEINYYIEQPDAFGPEWMITINITPVVENKMASWFKK